MDDNLNDQIDLDNLFYIIVNNINNSEFNPSKSKQQRRLNFSWLCFSSKLPIMDNLLDISDSSHLYIINPA